MGGVSPLSGLEPVLFRQRVHRLTVYTLFEDTSFETTTAAGRLMLNILGSLAEFELELIRERVKAGMDRARRRGKRIGRPGVTDRRGFDRRFGAILERLSSGELSRRKAAFEPGIGYATLKRLINAQEPAG